MNKLKSYVLFGAFLLVVGVSDFSAYGDDNYPASDRHEMDVEDNSCDYMQILTSGKTWNWIILYENGHFEPGYAEVADNVEIAGYSCKRVSSILGEEAFSPIRKSYILREDGPKLMMKSIPILFYLWILICPQARNCMMVSESLQKMSVRSMALREDVSE